MVAACSSSVPRTLTKILAWRRSPLTSTCVTLAKPTRGSLTRVRSKSLSSIAINSPSFSCLCGFGMHLFPSAYKGQMCKKIARNCGAFAPYFFVFPFCPGRAINRHQPNKKLIAFRRGEGGEERQGGPLRSPASWSLCSPDGLCQPNGGRYVLHPVGTRGAVGWMSGPGTCPRGEATEQPRPLGRPAGQAQGPLPAPRPPLVPTGCRQTFPIIPRFGCQKSLGNASTSPPPGDHKGPPFPTSSALAPTDHPACCPASRLRLMPIGADKS